ncbi:hypothetical protein EHI8A_073350 [Entamoeba histolytica HM-1:IMSS-B]|uniref:Uncharacterized protein n=6 Tax=Entamoeba histolytica TaxID=5759 RepID=C4MA68_ENTH1|nr:hypothetical protein EHI_018610 [Entamoeba histolytica HM-1:IMSS]EMD42388.1 Hypothetical protein EHI5A_113100 [Entamoeba histolytica KU27]EMH72325.1 hypothetical protein EHI8A_073350 [Entamoeba histolytica HM-1:IMSS-B]EMS16293.1 hypothetical protein KM1_136660 [Entamoeba histolytica HM-3:IMSS]ENY64177.1 hypothetical protein EHI7A_070830 [Entamoeba histolytica HM-1:IMSS-A]GAT98656.1 hypothetical protein CL6EHI_018610 [Entamoeba histolytica]|eukprot:XP_654769.1 hypothetical protein EHI_018610 [Entamoeba histolytica HM-1:IMSS]
MSSRDPTRGEENCVQWNEEEINTLKNNMEVYPEDKYSELKRYTLLLTNLPHKRLRDVAARVKYLKYIETHPTMTWSDFCKDKTLIRPQRIVTITKCPSHSSSQDSDVEGSSVRVVRKRSPSGTTPMPIEKPLGQDSVDGNVSDSMQIEENSLKSPVVDISELPSIPIVNAQQLNKQTPSVSKSKRINKIVRKNKINKLPQTTLITSPAPNTTIKVEQQPTIIITNEEQNSQLPPATTQNDISQVEQMLFQGETILTELMQSSTTELSISQILNFQYYVAQVMDFSSQLAKPLELPQMFSMPFTIEDIQQLIQQPQLIKMYEEQLTSTDHPMNNSQH